MLKKLKNLIENPPTWLCYTGATLLVIGMVGTFALTLEITEASRRPPVTTTWNETVMARDGQIVRNTQQDMAEGLVINARGPVRLLRKRYGFVIEVPGKGEAQIDTTANQWKVR